MLEVINIHVKYSRHDDLGTQHREELHSGRRVTASALVEHRQRCNGRHAGDKLGDLCVSELRRFRHRWNPRLYVPLPVIDHHTRWMSVHWWNWTKHRTDIQNVKVDGVIVLSFGRRGVIADVITYAKFFCQSVMGFWSSDPPLKFYYLHSIGWSTLQQCMHCRATLWFYLYFVMFTKTVSHNDRMFISLH